MGMRNDDSVQLVERQELGSVEIWFRLGLGLGGPHAAVDQDLAVPGVQQRRRPADLQIPAQAGHAYPVVTFGLGLRQASSHLSEEVLALIVDLTQVGPGLVNGLGLYGRRSDDLGGPADLLLDLV